MCKAGSSATACFPDGYYWTEEVCDDVFPSMNYARAFLNAVIAPNADIFVFGGEQAVNNFVTVAERFNGSSWATLDTATGARDYHSTAALLPDGRILTAGGEHRSHDYQVFVPPDLASGPQRPLIVSTGGTMSYNSSFTVNYEHSDTAPAVSKVVLIRPASITHHHDADQRYIELPVTGSTSNSITVSTPPDEPGKGSGPFTTHAPKGYYMLFLVLTSGVWSEAHWVQL